jgi:eukaryotic-like serine/threonine-protein kinase
MEKIKLPNGEWEYDTQEPLGKEGGFGQVFSGKSKDGNTVAVKRLKIAASDAAHRELRVADELSTRTLTCVIPIFDSGEDADTGRYFVVMPKAERSLQDDLEHGDTFQTVAIDILLQIIYGLVEVSDIVHRDLKPANILYHEGRWKIADFGIARFYEDSTSLETLKACLSPLYAAPEQWKLERATHATDIYALGCIGVCLLSGSPPFTNNPREEHLNDTPSISCSDPRLKSLLSMMLRKLPGSRPSIERVRTILTEIKSSEITVIQPSFSKLSEIGAIVAERELQKETVEEKKRQAKRDRDSLSFDALKFLMDNYCRLVEKIILAAPIAVKEDLYVSLGPAKLDLSRPIGNKSINKGRFPSSKWDVVVNAQITVVQGHPHYQRSSTLWYVKLPGSEDYRWMETSYFTNPMISHNEPFEPFALLDLDKADEAASNIVGIYSIAFGPKAIDDENEEDFHERWMTLFSQAANGQLKQPRELPIRD